MRNEEYVNHFKHPDEIRRWLTMSGWMYRTFHSDTLSACLDAYERDMFSRVEPSFLASRQACLDAHEFSRIEGSPLVTARVLPSQPES